LELYFFFLFLAFYISTKLGALPKRDFTQSHQTSTFGFKLVYWYYCLSGSLGKNDWV